MNNAKIFSQLMNKYKLSDPLSDEVQLHIALSIKPSLKKVLKMTGASGLILFAALSIKFFLQKFGFKASIVQAKIIVAVSSICIASAVVPGSYKIVTIIIDQLNVTDIKIEDVKKDKLIINKALENKEIKPAVIPHYSIGIQPFKGDAATAKKITQILISEIRQLNGKKSIIEIGNNKFDILLTGACRKLGDEYIITAKLIDKANSKTLHIISRDIKSPDELSKIGADIAKEIISKI